MKRRYAPAQIIVKLREADALPASGVMAASTPCGRI